MSEIIAKLEDFSLGKQSKPQGTFQKIGIVGCGSMGQEIVKTIAHHGFDVIVLDIDQAHVDAGIANIAAVLDQEIKHWGMTGGEKRLLMSRIKGSVNYSDLADCDLVIETINFKQTGHSINPRREVLQKIENHVRPDAIITSNTATLMISDLTAELKHPERAVGLYFLSPADKVKVLEVVRSARTSPEAFEAVSRFVRMLEKKPIALHESPGNISARMICSIINEACTILMEGVASIQDIDELSRTSLGHQFGPFELADRIGLDKLQRWMDNLYDEFGDYRYKTSPVIKRLARMQLFGKVSGQGFYKYDANGKAIAPTSLS